MSTMSMKRQFSANGKNRVDCNFCDKDYNKMFDLMTHIRKKHNKEARDLNWPSCETCGTLYPTQENLTRHQKSAHKLSKSQQSVIDSSLFDQNHSTLIVKAEDKEKNITYSTLQQPKSQSIKEVKDRSETIPSISFSENQEDLNQFNSLNQEQITTPKSSCLYTPPDSEEQVKLRIKSEPTYTGSDNARVSRFQLEKKRLSFENDSSLSIEENIKILARKISLVKKQIYTLTAIKMMKTQNKVEELVCLIDPKTIFLADDHFNQDQDNCEESKLNSAVHTEVRDHSPPTSNKKLSSIFENVVILQTNNNRKRKSTSQAQETNKVQKIALKENPNKTFDLSGMTSTQTEIKKTNLTNEIEKPNSGKGPEEAIKTEKAAVSTNDWTKTGKLSGLILQPKIANVVVQQVILQPKLISEKFEQRVLRKRPVTSHSSLKSTFKHEQRDVRRASSDDKRLLSSLNKPSMTVTVTPRNESRKRHSSHLQQDTDGFEGSKLKRLCRTNNISILPTRVDNDVIDIDDDVDLTDTDGEVDISDTEDDVDVIDTDDDFDVIDTDDDVDIIDVEADDDDNDTFLFEKNFNDHQRELKRKEERDNFKLENPFYVKSMKMSKEENSRHFFGIGAGDTVVIVENRLELTEVPDYFPTYGPYMCEMCNTFVETNREFVHHIKTNHAEDLDFEVLRIMESHLKASAAWQNSN